MNNTLIDYLSSRRTVPSLQLDDPGPMADQLAEILTIAARVPDHGKLAPWRFIIFNKDQRLTADAWLRSRAAAISEFGEKGPETEKAARFVRAPVVVGVVSSPMEHPKIPVWEQQLSAAAVCLNLMHAAHALGYSAQWLTDWFTYDAEAAAYLGANDTERFAGFIHIGTPTIHPVERDRPDVDALTSHWSAEG